MSDLNKTLRILWPPVSAVLKQALSEHSPEARRQCKLLVQRLDKIAAQDDDEALAGWAKDEAARLRRAMDRTKAHRPSHSGAPTPETREAVENRKAATDPIADLYRRGAIDADQEQAAEEISRLYQAMVQRLDAVSRDYREAKVQTSKGPPVDPAGGLPERLAERHHWTYGPWSREMLQTPADPRQPGKGTLYGLVMAVLIDGRSVEYVRKAYRVRSERVTARIQTALHRYLQLRQAPPENPGAWFAETAEAVDG